MLSKANRFAASVSVSGDFLLIGAPERTALKSYVPTLPEVSRAECGEVYMLKLRRPGAPEYLWDTGLTAQRSFTMPYPHNYIIQDLGFLRYTGGCLIRCQR